MNSVKMLTAAAALSFCLAPAFAADSMSSDKSSPMMMKSGEVMMMKPDGTMAKMKTAAPK